jgi:putative oxidoreductase
MTESTRFDRLLEQGAALALTALRIGVGTIMAAHGWAKLCDMTGTAQSFAQLGIPAPQELVYLAVAGEFVGGLGVTAGLLTRVAALGPLCTMIVAILTVHLGHGLFAKNGGYEYPLLLLLASSFFAFNGAGPFSMDALLEKGAQARLSRAPRLRQQLPSQPFF